jgi:hypothetical protein
MKAHPLPTQRLANFYDSMVDDLIEDRIEVDELITDRATRVARDFENKLSQEREWNEYIKDPKLAVKKANERKSEIDKMEANRRKSNTLMDGKVMENTVTRDGKKA